MIYIRDKIHTGSLVRYNGREYVVSGIWYDVGGVSMVADLIKPTEGNSICFVKHIWDEEIEDCQIVIGNL
jgi:hypothetical protein